MKRQLNQSARRMVLLAMILSAFLLFTACSGSKLAESFDEPSVKQAARDVIEKFSTGQYDAITNNLVREDLKTALSEKVLAGAADQVLKDVGAFESFSNEVVAGTKDKTTGEDLATTVVVAKYANRKITYTISFNANMKVVGFYLK